MTVKRIVPDFRLEDPADARAFYEEVLGLTMVMDHGWIVTFAAPTRSAPQVSIPSQGGDRTHVPEFQGHNS